MRVHLINPSDLSFGLAVITPRWLFVLAAATPERFGTPVLVDETLERLEPTTLSPGDVVGISIHTGNALRGYEIGRIARARGAFVVYGGIHATLFPDEARERGVAHAVVSGDGDVAWPMSAALWTHPAEVSLVIAAEGRCCGALRQSPPRMGRPT